jgi:hypothetical protein
MHTQFCAHIRAHAYALVKMARIQPDPQVALELESVALEILKITQDYEISIRRLLLGASQSLSLYHRKAQTVPMFRPDRRRFRNQLVSAGRDPLSR